MEDRSRREFIVESAKATGAIVSISTLGSGFLLPKAARAADIDYPESTCGSGRINGKKILVAYATSAGSTAEIALEIGKEFCKANNTVDTKYVGNVDDISSYDAVVVGGPILYDKWISEASDFVKENEVALSKVPVAFFLTCLTLAGETEKSKRKAMGYAEKISQLLPKVGPESIGRLKGVLDFSKLSFFQRVLFRGMSWVSKVAEGDYRDWDAIRSWASDTQFALNDATGNSEVSG
jgi:menaquinone-dependent protoporphyrinogen oxidase